MVKKKSIPGVEVESMEVNTDSYPRLGQEPGKAESSETQTADAPSAEREQASAGAQAESPAPTATDAGSQAPVADAAHAAAPPPDTGTTGAAGAAATTSTSPEAISATDAARSFARRNGAQIAACIAITIAVAAFALGWSWRTESAAFQASLNEVDAAIADQQSRQRTLAGSLALLQLSARVREGEPFREEIAVAIELHADDPVTLGHLEALAPSAAQGTPPMGMLQASFEEVVMPSARKTSVSSFFVSVAGIFERALPRGDGPAAEPKPDMHEVYSGLENMYRAEQAVLVGDLDSAIATVRPYTASIPSAQQWLALAEQRLSADRAAAAVETIALEKLSSLR